MGKGLMSKLKQEKEDKYNYQYYVLTDVEALDIFFLKCNKARNQVNKFNDMIDDSKELFLK